MRAAIWGVALLVSLSLCRAEDWGGGWEIGGGVGYGFYRKGSIISPNGRATAGIRSRFTGTILLGEDRYRYIGGEVRYTYQDGDPFLSAGGVKTNIQGQSHAIHYDILIHVRPQEARLRPYVAAGIGAKLYVVSGPANPAAPLGDIGTLTTHDQTKFLAAVGGGVKFRVLPQMLLRFDFRDYITTFPRQLIAPAEGATARGIFHQLTPMVGVSYLF